MHTISTQIEIAATPAKVRAIFLDFDSYPSWSKSFIKSIEITKSEASPPTPDALQPGDTLNVTLVGAGFSPKVTANTPDEFKWLGSLPGLFSGEHAFKFQPSQTSEGHTLLVQEEAFSGALSFLVGETWKWGKSTREGFENFNRDIKARAESL